MWVLSCEKVSLKAHNRKDRQKTKEEGKQVQLFVGKSEIDPNIFLF